MQREWKIRARSHQCNQTGTAFSEGDTVVTAIFWNQDEGDFERRDFSDLGWHQFQNPADPTAPFDELAATSAATSPAPAAVPSDPPFSSWRSIYQPPPPPEDKSGPVAKESAESLLRRMIEEDLPGTENTRYVLALLLERRKQLKQTEAKESELGRMLFYEHVKSGELFLIKDPLLKLDELEPVQEEVAALLGVSGGVPQPQPQPQA